MFVLFITPLPSWDPTDEWRRPHPNQILYSRTALSASGGAIPPHTHSTGSWTFRRHSGILWEPGHRRGITQKLCHCWSGTLPPTPTAHQGDALGSSRTRTFLSPPGHSLGFPATSAWSQGPPCAQGNVSGFSRRLRLRLPVQLLTLCRVSVSVFGGLLRQSTHRRRLPGVRWSWGNARFLRAHGHRDHNQPGPPVARATHPHLFHGPVPGAATGLPAPGR